MATNKQKKKNRNKPKKPKITNKEKQAVGRPLTFKDPDEMQALVDKYFRSCRGEIVRTLQGEPILNKYGEVVVIGAKPMTVSGLTLALGFNSRQSLLNYTNKPEFMDVITRAKLIIYEYWETRLFDKEGANGAKFCIVNHVEGFNRREGYSLEVEKLGFEKEKTKFTHEMEMEKLAIAKMKADIGEDEEIEDDGFIEALEGQVTDIWDDEEEFTEEVYTDGS